VEFEGDTGFVEGPEVVEREGGFGKGEQALVAFKAAPMVLAEGGEDDVSKGELGFGGVAGGEVEVFLGECCFGEALCREEKAGTAVHQQADGFLQGDAAGVSVMSAVFQDVRRTRDSLVAGDEVVVEHGSGTVFDFGEGSDFEFDVDANDRGEALFEGMDGGAVAFFVEARRAVDEEEKFEVVVGGVSGGSGENAAFAPAVSSGEEEGLKFVSRDDALDRLAESLTSLGKLLFEGAAAIAGIAGRKVHAGSFR
jgi:hypothetical protein